MKPELTRREREFVEGKLRLSPGSPYERRIRSDLRKKFRGKVPLRICFFCEAPIFEGPIPVVVLHGAVKTKMLYVCRKCERKDTYLKVVEEITDTTTVNLVSGLMKGGETKHG